MTAPKPSAAIPEEVSAKIREAAHEESHDLWKCHDDRVCNRRFLGKEMYEIGARKFYLEGQADRDARIAELEEVLRECLRKAVVADWQQTAERIRAAMKGNV